MKSNELRIGNFTYKMLNSGNGRIIEISLTICRIDIVTTKLDVTEDNHECYL